MSGSETVGVSPALAGTAAGPDADPGAGGTPAGGADRPVATPRPPAFGGHPYLRVLLVLAGLVAWRLWQADSLFQQNLFNTWLLFTSLVIGFWFVFGVAGHFAFSQAAFAGLGAYTAVWATGNGWAFELALVLAVGVCTVVALAFALLVRRAAHLYFAIATLGLSEVLLLVFRRWRGFTGGGEITNISPISLFGWEVAGPDRDQRAFWLLLGLLGLLLVLGYLLERSPVVRETIAARDRPLVAASAGVPGVRVRAAMMGLGSAVAGLVGAVLAHWRGSVVTEEFGVDLGLGIFLMLILGGMRSKYGPLLGAWFFVYVEDWLRGADDHLSFLRGGPLDSVFAFSDDLDRYWPILFGGLLVVVMITMPDGLIGIGARLRRRTARLRPPSPLERLGLPVAATSRRLPDLGHRLRRAWTARAEPPAPTDPPSRDSAPGRPVPPASHEPASAGSPVSGFAAATAPTTGHVPHQSITSTVTGPTPEGVLTAPSSADGSAPVGTAGAAVTVSAGGAAGSAAGGDGGAEGTAVLEVRGVQVSFGGVRAVDGVDLSVGPGEIVGLIGPNGSGKSTLLNAITGVVPAQGGLAIDGRRVPLGRPQLARRAGAGRTYQTPQTFTALTCLENVLLGVADRRRSGVFASVLARPWILADEHRRWAAADAALTRVGLAGVAERPAAGLAHRDQRLLELARALVGGPRVLLLDEPSAGLNASETEGLCELLGTIRAEGVSLLVVDHKIDVITALCDRVAVLDQGTLIAHGHPQEVWADQRVIDVYLGVPAEAETTEPTAPVDASTTEARTDAAEPNEATRTGATGGHGAGVTG